MPVKGIKYSIYIKDQLDSSLKVVNKILVLTQEIEHLTRPLNLVQIKTLSLLPNELKQILFHFQSNLLSVLEDLPEEEVNMDDVEADEDKFRTLCMRPILTVKLYFQRRLRTSKPIFSKIFEQAIYAKMKKKFQINVSNLSMKLFNNFPEQPEPSEAKQRRLHCY